MRTTKAIVGLVSLAAILTVKGTGVWHIRFFRGRLNPQSLVEDFR